MPEPAKATSESVEVEKTGLYAVVIYETKNYLFAVHGPYSSTDEAKAGVRRAMDHIVDINKGGWADYVPLWRPGREAQP